MFKRGAFDLGATVCPVAIRYNKIFVDAFWNSKRQSFTAHLVRGHPYLPLEHPSDPEILQPYLGAGVASHAFPVGTPVGDRAQVKLMTSWAVVCDVCFLEPQTLLPPTSRV